jgi:hypothetical protein
MCNYQKGRKAASAPSLILIIGIVILINFATLQADIIFPARIEMKESVSGEFDVLFTLPIIQNKKIKAELELPSVCRELSEHIVSATYTSYIETWKVGCKPEDLFGQSIVIEGLLGTYVEMMLRIEMLDGRVYSTTLKPSRAFFTIPEPLSIYSLLVQSSYLGVRKMVMHPEIYLLLFFLVFFITQRRDLIYGLIGYIFTHMIGQYMAQEQLIKLSPHLSHFVVLIIVLFPSFDLVYGRPALRRWFQPIWMLAIILGFLTGGAYPDTLSIPGMSFNEQYIVTFGINIGLAFGLLAVFYLIREFKQLLTMFVLRTRPHMAHIILGYMIGISACAFIIYRSTSFLIASSILPEVSLEYFIFPILFGYWYWQNDTINPRIAIVIFLIFMGLGMIIGGMGISIPMGSLIFYASILAFSSQLLFDWKFPPVVHRVIPDLAVFFFGWTISYNIHENLTLPMANTVGFASLAIFLFYIAYNFLSEKSTTTTSNLVRILAGVTGIFIIYLRIDEYILLFNRDIATSLAMGQLTIPLLTLTILIGTLLVWPRKRRIHQELEVETKKPIKHWTFICLSFLVLPFGHWVINNPLFTSHAPQDNEAKLVLQKVLSNTYHAFNLDDEDALYQALAESVTGELVANIYLDSRRRLTAGVRQGGEVTVRDVSVVSVSDLIEGQNAADGFSYQSKWTVTARVKHLQHIHHRKNIYSGILKIKVEDNVWKISHIELQSEDRMIVAGRKG